MIRGPCKPVVTLTLLLMAQSHLGKVIGHVSWVERMLIERGITAMLL